MTLNKDLGRGKADCSPKPPTNRDAGPPQPSRSQPPKCPECGSTKVWKDGHRKLADGSTVQRWLCRACGYRFSQPKIEFDILTKPLKKLNSGNKDMDSPILHVDFSIKKPPDKGTFMIGKDVGAHIPPHNGSITENLNSLRFYNRNCRVCAWEVQAKNSASPMRGEVMTSEATAENRAAGATTKPSEAELKAKIIEFLWWMKKQGYRETTIRGKGKRLMRLVKLGANLFDPESVKEVLARESWSDSGKQTTAYAYDLFAKWAGIKWERPKYKAARKLPFIPQEREIDDLIAGCNRYVATFLQIAKETGARAGEIFNLKWIDVDLERRTLKVTPEKGGNPRIFRISRKLADMLEAFPRDGERIFSHYKDLRSLMSTFERNRKRIAYKLGNPRILKISFHTLRHWKATMEYAKTKDILHVMELLGHRNIKNTLIYTQLIKLEGEEEYICRVAKTVEQAAELIEAGFEYVCDIDGVKLFRKRK